MTNPTLISTPFATAGGKNTIQESVPLEPNNPTWLTGFPTITSTPVSEGGLPPKRLDFNGVLNAITENTVHQTKGLGYEFDATYATKIRGYPLHAVLTLTNGERVQSTVANNIIDPNVNMTGWKPTKDSNVITTVESIADLIAIQNPKDGQVVQAKGFYEATNFELAQPYKGGGFFIFDASKKSVNDGFLTHDGWVRQFENNIYTPYMSGCRCDDITDDTVSLDKLLYALEVNNLGGTVLFEDDMYFNSFIESKGKLQYTDPMKVGYVVIRIVDNVTYQINNRLRFGSFYNGKIAHFVGAKYCLDTNDLLGRGLHYNVKLIGVGEFDFTGAGTLATKYQSRLWFEAGNIIDLEVSGLTVRGGDFVNTIFTTYWGSNHRIHDNTFIDQMSDAGVSSDHSTLYMIGTDVLVYNNTFIQTSKRARLNACTCEFHGNDQHYYGNKFYGYRNTIFIAAYKLGFEGIDDTYRGDITVYGNSGISASFITFWTDSRLPLGVIRCYYNRQDVIPFLSRADALSAGIPASMYDSLPQYAYFVGTMTDQNGYNFPPSPNALIDIHDNIYLGARENYTSCHWLSMSHVIEDGLQMYRNTITTRQLFTLDSRTNMPMKLRRFVFEDNDISWAHLNKLPLTGNIHYLQNCRIALEIDHTYAASGVETVPVWLDIDEPQNTFNNVVKVIPINPQRHYQWLGGSVVKQERNWYTYNTVEYGLSIKLGIFNVDSARSSVLYTSHPSISKGVKHFDVSIYEASKGHDLVLPPQFMKDMRVGAVANQIVASALYVAMQPDADLNIVARGIVRS